MKMLRNLKAQALIEAVIVLPMLLALFIGTIYFGSLMFNQQAAYMASRHAAWLKTKLRLEDTDIKNKIREFFAEPDNIGEPSIEQLPLHTGVPFVDEILGYLPIMNDNYKVGVSYRQPGMPYAAPVYLNPEDELIFSFQEPVRVKTAECAMPSRNTWKSAADILRSLLGI